MSRIKPVSVQHQPGYAVRCDHMKDITTGSGILTKPLSMMQTHMIAFWFRFGFAQHPDFLDLGFCLYDLTLSRSEFSNNAECSGQWATS